MLGVLVLLACVLSASAQEGKLKVRANPREAYLFVDGQAMRDARSAARLSSGQHNLGQTPNQTQGELGSELKLGKNLDKSQRC